MKLKIYRHSAALSFLERKELDNIMVRLAWNMVFFNKYMSRPTVVRESTGKLEKTNATKVCLHKSSVFDEVQIGT